MMYEVVIKRVYVPAASAEMAIRQTARTLKNGRMLKAHPQSSIEATVLSPDEGQPDLFLAKKLKDALPHHGPNRDEQGHFIQEAS